MPNASTKTLNITALILSGGAGQRFGGEDKGLQTYFGKPLIEHVISAIQPQVSNVLISVNRNLDSYKQFGFDLIVDHDQSHQGPMAGIAATIKHLRDSKDTHTDALLISPCDSPQLPSNYVALLSQQLQIDTGSPLVAVAHDGHRRQNLHCLIRREAWVSLSDFYEGNNRAMHKWFNTVDLSEFDFSAQANCFANINSPDQLA